MPNGETRLPPEDTTDEFLVELVEDGDAYDDEPLLGDNDVGLESVGEIGIGSGTLWLSPLGSSRRPIGYG